MKAIRIHEFGPPDVMKLDDVSDLNPEADQILIKLSAIGVNPVDSYMRSGAFSRVNILPYIPGTDGAGVVVLKECSCVNLFICAFLNT